MMLTGEQQEGHGARLLVRQTLSNIGCTSLDLYNIGRTSNTL